MPGFSDIIPHPSTVIMKDHDQKGGAPRLKALQGGLVPVGEGSSPRWCCRPPLKEWDGFELALWSKEAGATGQVQLSKIESFLEYSRNSLRQPSYSISNQSPGMW